MAFYLIGDVIVKDEVAYEQYRVEASKLISKHDGKYLVRGGKFEIVSGNWRPTRLIMLEFPDKQSVDAYLTSPEFSAMSELRNHALHTDIVCVEGV
jgi:uncharacterized protein (DUF1330 family)